MWRGNRRVKNTLCRSVHAMSVYSTPEVTTADGLTPCVIRLFAVERLDVDLVQPIAGHFRTIIHDVLPAEPHHAIAGTRRQGDLVRGRTQRRRRRVHRGRGWPLARHLRVDARRS